MMLTNPDCWKTCSNMNEQHTDDNYPYHPFTTPTWPLTPQRIGVTKKITRTIEKYGPNGEYLGKEIITEETYDEAPPSPPWSGYEVTCMQCW